MGASIALLLCLLAFEGAAAATSATTAESTIAFLPPPDKVDVLKAVTDPQLEGEACCKYASQQMMVVAANTLQMCYWHSRLCCYITRHTGTCRSIEGLSSASLNAQQ